MKTNHRKHGVTFEIACQVFDDPYALAEQDRIENGEVRWQTIGMVNGLVLLLVAHTAESSGDFSDEFIRIISARRTDRKERNRYEKERKKNYC